MEKLNEYRPIIALVLILAPALVLGMAEAGFVFVEWALGWTVGIIVSVVGGVAGMLLATGGRQIVQAAIVGAALSAGIFAALILYLDFRETIIRIELVVPVLLGCIPGGILYALLFRSAEGKDATGDSSES